MWRAHMWRAHCYHLATPPSTHEPHMHMHMLYMWRAHRCHFPKQARTGDPWRDSSSRLSYATAMRQIHTGEIPGLCAAPHHRTAAPRAIFAPHAASACMHACSSGPARALPRALVVAAQT